MKENYERKHICGIFGHYIVNYISDEQIFKQRLKEKHLLASGCFSNPTTEKHPA